MDPNTGIDTSLTHFKIWSAGYKRLDMKSQIAHGSLLSQKILLRSIYLCKHGKACQVGGEERHNREIPWLNSWKLPGERQSSFYSPTSLPLQGLRGERFKGMDLPRQAIPWPAMVCLHTPQTLGFLKSFFLKLWGHVVNSSGWKSKGRKRQHFSSWPLLLLLFFFFFPRR